LARAALADRLPAQLLQARQRGGQAVDWHEGVEADLALLREEISRIAASEPAARVVDTPRLARMAEAWPSDGFERPRVIMSHRTALLRGVSIGHFMRRASGGNG
jgi:asparagine synthase (glutamine-hydrolysing)